MSRTIKFRAWDKQTKTMIDLQKITPLATDLPGLFIPSHEDIIPLQFTGILDKNGREIWEGDIVVKDGYIWFDDGKQNYRGTIEWIYSQWQVVAHCVAKKRGISDGINTGLNESGIEEGEKSDWEIIGNIYEHPELLKGREPE